MTRYRQGMLLVLASGSVLAAPMDSYQLGSGFGPVDTGSWFRSVFYAGLALYGCWSIGTGLWSWVQGSISEMHLFFVVFRSALMMVLASFLVSAVT